MTETENNCIKGIICFEPDLEFFNMHVRGYYNTLVNVQDAWLKFCTSDQFLTYCKTCLRVYIHLSFGEDLQRYQFASESKAKIIATIGMPYVPTFVLDMIREICRPMYLGSDYNVQAYYPLDQEGTGLVPGLGWDYNHVSVSNALFRIAPDRCSSLVEERPGKSPIYLSTDRKFIFINGQTQPQSRIDSVNALRFLRPHGKYMFGWKHKNSNPGNPSLFELETIHKLDFADVRLPEHREYAQYPESGTVHDRVGVETALPKFARGNLETAALVPPFDAEDPHRPGSLISVRPTAEPLEGFLYPNFCTPPVAHKIIRLLNASDAELGSEFDRAAYALYGTAFQHDTAYRLLDYTKSRFPSEESPSHLADKPFGEPGRPARSDKDKRAKKKSTKKVSEKKVITPADSTNEDDAHVDPKPKAKGRPFRS